MSRMTLISKIENVYTPNQVQLQFGANPAALSVNPNPAPAANANITISTAEASGLVVGNDYDVTISPVG